MRSPTTNVPLPLPAAAAASVLEVVDSSVSEPASVPAESVSVAAPSSPPPPTRRRRGAEAGARRGRRYGGGRAWIGPYPAPRDYLQSNVVRLRSWARTTPRSGSSTRSCATAPPSTSARSDPRTRTPSSPSTPASRPRRSTAGSSRPARCSHPGTSTASPTSTTATAHGPHRHHQRRDGRCRPLRRQGGHRRGRGRLRHRGPPPGPRARFAPARAPRRRGRGSGASRPSSPRRWPTTGRCSACSATPGSMAERRFEDGLVHLAVPDRRDAGGHGGDGRAGAAGVRAVDDAAPAAPLDRRHRRVPPARIDGPRRSCATSCRTSSPDPSSRSTRRRRRSPASPPTPSVEDVPSDVDLAIVTVPKPEVPGVVEACGRKGVRAVVVISSGFAETGARSRHRRRAGARPRRPPPRHAAGRAQRHGRAVDDGRGVDERHVPRGVTARRARRVPRPVGRARHRRAAAGGAPGHRLLELRVGRQPRRRQRQRPPPVLGGRRRHRRHPAVPRDVREPPQVRPHRPPGRATRSRSSS